MIFENPQFLNLIWLVFISIGIGFLFFNRRKYLIKTIGKVELIKSFSRLELRFEKLKIFVMSLIIAMLVLTMAGPLQETSKYLKEGTVEVICLVDVSRSMGSHDFGNKSRLDRSKEIMKSLFQWLNGNDMGIVTYAGSYFIAAPLTNDYTALSFIIDEWIDINSVQKSGSNLFDPMQFVLKGHVFKDNNKTKIVLLFSDGGGTETLTHVSDAAFLFKRYSQHFQTIVIGLGSLQGVDIVNATGQAEITKLQEKALIRLAQDCGGKYLNGNKDIDLSADIIGKLKDSEKMTEGYIPRFQIPLLSALGLFLFVLFL